MKAFYIRRALRLMPALGLLLLATGTFALFCLPKEKAAEVYQGILLTLSYVSNWVFALNPRVQIGALGITWSLAIEEQFYLVWPLLLSLALKLKVRRRTIIFALLFAVVAVLLHRRLLFEEGAILRRLYYATDTRADGLLVGCIVGLLLSANMIPRGRYFRSVMFALALAAAAFIVYFVATSSMGDAILYDGLFTVVALAIGLLLTVLLLWPPAAIMACLRFPPLRWIGRISYGLYLWHWPIQHFLGDKSSSSWRQTIGLLLIVFAVTILSFYCVEKPFLRLKGKFASA